jgi:hypothetical protein
MMLSPPPHTRVDWTVPTDQSGREIGVARTQSDYQFYLHRLADYLYETDITVPECQRNAVRKYASEGGAQSAVCDLGFTMGILYYDIEDLERLSLEGVGWETVHSEEMAHCNEYSEEERETISEEGFCASREDYERIGREAGEAQRIPSHVGHLDIPFRPVFAALLKNVPDHEERYRLLNRFYGEFNDAFSK